MHSTQHKNKEIQMLPTMEIIYSINEIDPPFIHSHANSMQHH
jgi:hypothetical protein